MSLFEGDGDGAKGTWIFEGGGVGEEIWRIDRGRGLGDDLDVEDVVDVDVVVVMRIASGAREDIVFGERERVDMISQSRGIYVWKGKGGRDDF